MTTEASMKSHVSLLLIEKRSTGCIHIIDAVDLQMSQFQCHQCFAYLFRSVTTNQHSVTTLV